MYQIEPVFNFLKFLNEVLNKPGPITLDVGILQHSDNFTKYDSTDDIYIIGTEDSDITLEDITKVFDKIRKNKKFIKEMDSGRTYFYEYLHKKKNKDNSWYTAWGL
jgi:hypothetical protein